MVKEISELSCVYNAERRDTTNDLSRQLTKHQFLPREVADIFHAVRPKRRRSDGAHHLRHDAPTVTAGVACRH